MRCEKCGKVWKPCIKECPDCFDYVAANPNAIGPLQLMGLAQADKIWAEAPCPLVDEYNELFKLATNLYTICFQHEYIPTIKKKLEELGMVPNEL